jgi:hypothetical protein
MSGTSSRGNPSMGDILRSVAVLGAIILALFALGRFFTVAPDEPTRTVDYQSAAQNSRKAATFELLAPRSLPEGWRATSVRFGKSSWHLGVVTDDEKYVGLEQVKAEVGRAVERFAEGSSPKGDAVVDGETWTLHTGPRDDLTFARRDGDMTVVVTGSASRAELERYIASLSSS